jgi:hypothetical protein
MSPEELFFDLQSIGAGNRAVALTVLFSCHQKFVLGECVPAVLKAFLDDIEDQRDSLEKGELNKKRENI